MRVVVTGATGYVGSALVSALRRAGHEVAGIVRPQGDIARPETVASLAEHADAVVHAAIASTPDAPEIDRRFVERMLAWAAEAPGDRRFVYTSGLWVLGDTHGRIADETSTPSPPALVAWRPEVEALVTRARSRGAAAWTVRPGIVYGGAGGLTAMMLASLEQEGAVRIAGDGENHWPLVHRDDLAELYVAVLEKAPDAPILHATDGSQLTLGEIARALGDGRVLTTPLDAARAALGALADALALDQRISCERTMRLLDFRPRHRSIVDEAPSLRRAYNER